ncbi:elongation factor Ts, mitochondrial isoform X1 [Pararge aegeria]|uniref:Elongation factor Ts, mitochondrial n=3 Tax=Pararge aegeria TaxID=116150 RepID=A0A8S4RRY5_9NEOP|nr:elongation factor Ts, mitochondrial isoform X1 [Pararge aegeria]XP_039765200.1 elongation factor Ts, mitochondrial isoform X1 [Pararge aegeria]CAH2239897.1 jg2632 [Pararge aegeria aegeria]
MQQKVKSYSEMILQLVRRLHITPVCQAAESSLLAKLRKKTGYTIANCKKALEMNNNDTDKAEAWLNEQAQAMGWAKATKLAGRKALQGLVAVKFDKNHGALVELNCETDFVAKNDKFQKVLEDATLACYKFAHTNLQSKGPITKLELDSEQLGSLSAEGGKKLSEVLALFIGSVGENAILRRAECWKANSNDVKITAYTHPALATPSDYSTGRYGALLAYKQPNDIEDVGKHICQHIVGCAPRKIGDKEKDKPTENSDDETCLIYQEYLLDPSYTVEEVLQSNKVEVLDYVRFSCGEEAETEMPGVEKQPLDSVQTLQ